jgi:hypothetical protein
MRVMSVIQAAKNKMDPRCAEVSIYIHTHTYYFLTCIYTYRKTSWTFRQPTLERRLYVDLCVGAKPPN